MSIDPTKRNELTVGVVIGGHQAKPDIHESGLVQVGLVHHYGVDVSEDHIGFSQMLMPANQGGATEFNGVPDPGQQVLCLKVGPPGASDLIVLGCFPTVQQDGAQEGNKVLNKAVPWLEKAPKNNINVAIAPAIKEIIKDGARIRQIVEKGILHSHDILKGIPSHAAIYPLAGIPQKQLTNIATATQAFSSILTGDMMAALPGTVFSLGNLLNSLTDSALDEIFSSMPPQLAQGTRTLFNLMQTIETIESGGFNTMGKVDPTSFLSNATSLLKGNQSMGEVIQNVIRLQSDTSLFGLDKLASASFEVPTAFGTMKMSLSPTGAIVNELPKEMQTAIKAFSTLMTSGENFPNATLSNMFGDSASVMASLFDRLPVDKQTNAKNMMEKVIGSGSQSSGMLNSVEKFIRTGQNIANFF